MNKPVLDGDDYCSSDEEILYTRPNPTPVVKTLKPSPIIDRDHGLYEETRRPPSVFLPLAENEYRIVKLHKGRRNEQIICSFFNQSIDDEKPEEYETVSYRWGADESSSPRPIVSITVQDLEKKNHQIWIRDNVFAALQSLRHPRMAKNFWIDSISINYGSETDKTNQTKLKWKIFSKSRNLCFWLDHEPYSKAAFDFIPRMLDMSKTSYLVQDVMAIACWLAFVALLKTTAFSRVWLLQEVSLSQNVTLHCGGLAIHYNDFVDAVTIFTSHRSEIAQLFRCNGRNYTELSGRKVTRAERFVNISAGNLSRCSAGLEQGQQTLESIVSQISNLNCADPRDRIFSMVALARKESIDPSTNINYLKPTLEVFQDFVGHCISSSQSLDIICRNWAAQSKDKSYPTWVLPLEYSANSRLTDDSSVRTSPESLVGLPGHSYYNSSRVTVPVYRIEKINTFAIHSSLFVEGFRIDTILKLGPRAEGGIIFHEWLELGGCAVATETVPEAFWKTLVADRGPNGSIVPLWYKRAFLHCLSLSPTGTIDTNKLIAAADSGSSLVVDFLQRVQGVIWNRKFFVSKDNNWIGLAPMTSEVGDSVCILFGCSVPVILRSCLNTNGENHFQLVGECYVHGMMDGQVEEVVKVIGCNKEEFEIR